ncbi:hypothetical protein GF357_01275 [Candidatus Dojkabacteria bacterium]|nr:hypothetical protein [Candidatus Dojkabacteria bacterium]
MAKMSKEMNFTSKSKRVLPPSKLLAYIWGVVVITVITLGYFFYRDLVKPRLNRSSGVAGCTPYNVDVVEITENSVNFTWETDDECYGLVRYGTDKENLAMIALGDNVQRASNSHNVEVKMLSPRTTYYFVVVSENEEYGFEGIPISITTKLR